MVDSEDNNDRFFVQSCNEDNANFISRQKSVFEKLDAVAIDKEKEIEIQNKHKYNHRDVMKKDVSLRKRRIDTRQFRGQESIFKRPEAPLPARFKKSVPDYQRHPHKWTKYTLSDVSPEDMSERSNTAAAMIFLQELQSKKDLDNVDKEETKITFKKPNFQKKNETHAIPDEKFESSSFRSSKVVMPEYVVGAKKSCKRSLTKNVEKGNKLKEIKLDHLNNDE